MSNSSRKPSVLVCDDEEGVRESLKLILSENYDVIFATNGAEALDQMAGKLPDAVILDIKMPKVNGLEVL